MTDSITNLFKQDDENQTALLGFKLPEDDPDEPILQLTPSQLKRILYYVELIVRSGCTYLSMSIPQDEDTKKPTGDGILFTVTGDLETLEDLLGEENYSAIDNVDEFFDTGKDQNE